MPTPRLDTPTAAQLFHEDGAPVTGNANTMGLPRTLATGTEAVAHFDAGPITPRLLPPALIDNRLRTKRQEVRDIQELSEVERVALRLGGV